MINPVEIPLDQFAEPASAWHPDSAQGLTAKETPAMVGGLVQPYELLVHTIEGIVWEVDLDSFQFTFVSQQAERFLGYPASQWLTEKDFWVNHMHPEDRSWAPAFCLAATQRKQDHTFEYRMLAADGRVVWLRDAVNVVCNAAAQPIKLRGVMIDVTTQKKFELALAQSESRYRDLFEKANDALFIVDAQDHILNCNARAAELFGYTQEVLCTLKVSDLEPPDLHRPLPNLVTHDVHLHGASPFEVEACRADGTRLALEITNTVLEGQAGQVLSIVRDVTERKRLELELRLAKETAESATCAKSDFLTTTSHEIASPLDTILGLANVLLEMPLAAPQKALVKTIRHNSQLMLGLIHDLLDISKIEAGLLTLEAQPFDLRDCVCAVCETVMPEAVKKGLELSYEVAPAVSELVVSDAKRLRQMLINLVSNAVKFTETGEVVLTVQAEAASALGAKSVLHFQVRDTGVGIPSDQLEKIFDRYHQNTFAASRRKGLGLGLFITRQLAALLQGKLWAESTGVAGQGSQFHLLLPVTAVASPHSAYLNSDHSHLEDRRVLLVEASETTQRILQNQCRLWGMEVHATGSAAEALEWLRRGAMFEVGLIDLYLPEMTGYDLAAALRTLCPEAALPLVVLSSVEQFVEPAAPLPKILYLPKPIKLPVLYQILFDLFAPHKN